MMIKLPSVLAVASSGDMTVWQIMQKTGIYVAVFVMIFLWM